MSRHRTAGGFRRHHHGRGRTAPHRDRARRSAAYARTRARLFLHRDMAARPAHRCAALARSEEHTSELQSLMRISYAVFCLKKKTKYTTLYAHHIGLSYKYD